METNVSSVARLYPFYLLRREAVFSLLVSMIGLRIEVRLYNDHSLFLTGDSKLSVILQLQLPLYLVNRFA